MALLGTGLLLLVLGQGVQIGGIELETGRYGRRRNRNLSVKNDTHSQETRNSKIPGSNGAASNNGGIIKWENVTARFSWRRKRQTVGKAFILILF